LAVATFGPRQILWLGQVKGEFTGLGAGRWRIEVWPAGSDRGASHEDRALEIEVDGEHDRVLDVDASGWLVPMPK
jgi:hypothetical protein